MLISLTVTLPVFGDDHPTTVGPREGRGDHEWYAASRVLTRDGAVRAVRLPEHLRDGLEFQIRGNTANHALEDGDIPPEKHCAESMEFASFPPAETAGDFASLLLLSEVAVIATLGEGVPGFTAHGNPMMLFALTDVVRLHGLSWFPEYLLVPLDRIVVGSRIFCSLFPTSAEVWHGTRPPVEGDRYVVLGSWLNDGVIRVRAYGPDTAVMARVGKDGRLAWHKLGYSSGGPGTLAELHARADEAVAGRLFELTAHLRGQDYGSPERREWAEMWRRLNNDRCRVVDAVEFPGEGLVPGRRLCTRSAAEQ